MKVLFLDIDGVLNSVDFSQKQVRRSLLADTSQIDPVACAKIKNLVKAVPDLKIVISSTWRKLFSLEELTKELEAKGIPSVIISATPVIHNTIRGEEIKDWLKDHPEVSKFAIVDDDADMGELLPYLIQTDVQVGITDEDVLKIIKLLN